MADCAQHDHTQSRLGSVVVAVSAASSSTTAASAAAASSAAAAATAARETGEPSPLWFACDPGTKLYPGSDPPLPRTFREKMLPEPEPLAPLTSGEAARFFCTFLLAFGTSTPFFLITVFCKTIKHKVVFMSMQSSISRSVKYLL
jgi:hypothetical protein